MKQPPSSWLLNAASAFSGRRPPFVLCYHSVGDVAQADDPHGLCVPPRLFEAHLDLLIEKGYELVGASELWKRVAAGDAEGSGAITFDDVPADIVDNALPLLAERGANATLFAATGLTGSRHPDLAVGETMSRSQLAEASSAGFEVGAHTVDHLSLTSITSEQCDEQLRRSKGDLEDLLGCPVSSMAYPFGAVDSRVEAAAERAGYEIGCGCSGTGEWRPFRIPREPVFPSTSRHRLAVKAVGPYGPVHRVARLREQHARSRGPASGVLGTEVRDCDQGVEIGGYDEQVQRASLAARLSDRANAVVWRLPVPRRVRVLISNYVLVQPMMPLDRVLQTLSSLEHAGIEAPCSGGWGIDALAGTQTRQHTDLDLVVAASDAERTIETLHGIGYQDWFSLVDPAGYWYTRTPRKGEEEITVTMRDRAMRSVDLHFIDLERSGLTRTSGSIGEARVPCLSLEAQMQALDSYQHRYHREHHHVQVLRDAGLIEMSK